MSSAGLRCEGRFDLHNPVRLRRFLYEVGRIERAKIGYQTTETWVAGLKSDFSEKDRATNHALTQHHTHATLTQNLVHKLHPRTIRTQRLQDCEPHEP